MNLDGRRKSFDDLWMDGDDRDCVWMMKTDECLGKTDDVDDAEGAKRFGLIRVMTASELDFDEISHLRR